MMLKETIKKIVESQNEELKIDETIKRTSENNIDLISNHTIIITGIRRCGKSTLLKRIIKKLNGNYYLDFEDQRLASFEVSDFEKLEEVFKELYGESRYYFFDEIQNIKEWERYVRRKQDLGQKIIITGSNASLLSKELGTKLTGRYLSSELFPFSFNEWLNFKKEKPSAESFEKYLKEGGFPEFLKYKNPEILRHILNDILFRDIIVRYKLKDERVIKELSVFLLGNVGKELSFNKLRGLFQVGSTNTISSYIDYLEKSYLLFSISKFDYSYKKQLVNPKKIYSIDTAFASANSISFSEDKGRMLENAVFLMLRKKYKEIFYFKGKKECDFLIKEKEKITKAIQVCYELNEDNKEREITGVKEAIEKFNLKEGTIITLGQEDSIGDIKVMSAWKWKC